MIRVRKSQERGHANHGWLDTYHTFSFSDYYDPDFMGFRQLRVINEDYVESNEGFPTHPHRNMEIITYILSGALEHKDSMGTGSVIRPGDIQRMSAGRGVLHSEFNHSDKERVHLLQIWINPNVTGINPSYEQKFFSDEEKKNRLRIIASPNGKDGSVTIHQDVNLYASIVEENHSVQHELNKGRYAWLQVARGSLRVNDSIELNAGDGAAIDGESLLKIQAIDRSELLLFDLN